MRFFEVFFFFLFFMCINGFFYFDEEVLIIFVGVIVIGGATEPYWESVAIQLLSRSTGLVLSFFNLVSLYFYVMKKKRNELFFYYVYKKAGSSLFSFGQLFLFFMNVYKVCVSWFMFFYNLYYLKKIDTGYL